MLSFSIIECRVSIALFNEVDQITRNPIDIYLLSRFCHLAIDAFVRQFIRLLEILTFEKQILNETDGLMLHR